MEAFYGGFLVILETLVVNVVNLFVVRDESCVYICLKRS